MAPQAREPTKVRVRISRPTRMTAKATRGVAPPGNILTFRLLEVLLDPQTNMASRIWLAKNNTPVPTMVSSSWWSTAGPVVEISTGNHQVWAMKMATETTVMMVTTAANSFPMSACLDFGIATGTGAKAAYTVAAAPSRYPGFRLPRLRSNPKWLRLYGMALKTKLMLFDSFPTMVTSW